MRDGKEVNGMRRKEREETLERKERRDEYKI
jgi:hypothetical protein